MESSLSFWMMGLLVKSMVSTADFTSVMSSIFALPEYEVESQLNNGIDHRAINGLELLSLALHFVVGCGVPRVEIYCDLSDTDVTQVQVLLGE
jgi:hypothetical protein